MGKRLEFGFGVSVFSGWLSRYCKIRQMKLLESHGLMPAMVH
jgi:hypothetical protein